MWLTVHYLARICRSDSEKANEPEPQDEESRRVNTMQVCFSSSLKLTKNRASFDSSLTSNLSRSLILNSQCDIQRLGEGDKGLSGQLQLRILLRMEDNMNRQLSCSISQDEDPEKLANELVQHGFIHRFDHYAIKDMLVSGMARFYAEEGAYPGPVPLPPTIQ